MTLEPMNSLRLRLAAWCVAASFGLLLMFAAFTLFLMRARSRQAAEPLDAVWGDLLWAAGVSLPLVLIAACVAGVLIAALAVEPVADTLRRLQAIRPDAPSARLRTEGLSLEAAHLCDVINGLLAGEQQVQKKQALFATQAAHELRTPLTAQRSVGELALRGDPTLASLREAVSSMLEQGEHMDKLVDSLLLVARADGGMLGTPTTTIDASELAEAAVRSMLPLAEQKNQSLSIQTQDSRLVVAEATLLRQAVLNLIHNAIVHTPKDTRIDVGVRTNVDGEVVISITDDGPGFAAYEPGQVVHRYARRQEDRQGRGGLGLGLTIALSLVHAQGGKMIVDSRPGFGTAIRLHFPASDGPVSTAAAVRFGRRRSDQGEGRAGAPKRRPSVLTAVLKSSRR
ncbi:MAG: HAMP domain-containing histidine kinase [Methylibium sp.]|uniref:sensor histidine kinase n=1 Tax=Methylibium sp. TaxID=2067992 RepID=UPI0017D95703|nr:HAMP domain-containing sensor histidine kinase [Methylibium sp.]MBA3599137.1 HAMP domain-containing histidine kinase [Methylibium sp.]